MTLKGIPGQVPSPDQEGMLKKAAEYWRQVGIEAPVQAVTRVEDAAKQLIGLNAGLQALYFAVFAFSDLRKQIVALSFGAVLFVLVMIALLPAPPASGPTPIIILTPTPVSSPVPTP